MLLNISRWNHFFEIIKIEADIAEKYIENVLSFSQAAKYVFRKSTPKAFLWIPIPI